MTSFKIVFTFDVFLSAETTCTADVLHSYLVLSIGTRFVDPLFLIFFFISSLLWDVFIINSVEQLQTRPKTHSEIDISPFL